MQNFTLQQQIGRVIESRVIAVEQDNQIRIERSDIATLSALSTSKGDNRGVFCIDFNRTDQLCWLYFNFSLDDWQKKLEVSTGAVEIIQKQKRNETVCGILRENRILYVIKVVLRILHIKGFSVRWYYGRAIHRIIKKNHYRRS